MSCCLVMDCHVSASKQNLHTSISICPCVTNSKHGQNAMQPRPGRNRIAAGRFDIVLTWIASIANVRQEAAVLAAASLPLIIA